MSRNVLLLNASEEVINVIDWKRAITLLFSGKAQAPYNYEHAYEVKTNNGKFKLPCAIMLLKYVRLPFSTANPTRNNILKRDSYLCQYCSTRLTAKNTTLDHVIPKSRGGGGGWENLVSSCMKCNNVKGNRTPREANMPLNKKPRKETNISLLFMSMGDVEAWKRWNL